jgi:heme O synthase-like polyprenyltransferase
MALLKTVVGAFAAVLAVTGIIFGIVYTVYYTRETHDLQVRCNWPARRP